MTEDDPLADGELVVRDDGGAGVGVVLPARRGIVVLDSASLSALGAAIERVEARPGERRWIWFESAAAGSFAAGADLGEIARLDPVRAAELSRLGQRVLDRIRTTPLVTGALVDGHALGGGCDLALSCDVVVATPRARFGHPGLRRGLFTGWGGTREMQARGRPGVGRRLLLAAEEIDAAGAARAGLIASVTEPHRARALLCDRLARLAAWPESARRALRATWTGVIRYNPARVASRAWMGHADQDSRRRRQHDDP